MKSVVLVVLDGFGIAEPGPGNAIHLASPQNVLALLHSYPNTTLNASGEAVGLPPHEVGNTEVGHINLGAGRIVYQDLPKINMNIADGTFYKNLVFLNAIEHIKKSSGKLHLIGLVGEGTVHSSTDHLFALLHLARENHVRDVFVHAITDGRDSPPKSAGEILSRLEEKLLQLSVGKIASVMGRYYAMDRDRRWERTEKAYRCLTVGSSILAASATDVIKNEYKANKTDEFIEPTNIGQNGEPLALITPGDAVIFFNYRIDRPRQLTKAFVLDNFEEDANKSFSFDPYAVKYYRTHIPQTAIVNPPFKRGEKVNDLYFVTMTEYEKSLPTQIAFPPTTVSLPIGRVISEQGIEQLRISESEKERFVTFYFNGQREIPFPGEEHIIIPSPKVATYDLKPEMAAYEITDILVQKIYQQRYGFILVNFANADMVGHTGNIEACVKAIRVLDECLAKISHAALNLNTTLVITADHGNVEEKINLKTGGISTEHTGNPVPISIIDNSLQEKAVRLQTGVLADVAPTILSLMGLTKPSDMTGRNLLEEVT